MSVPLGTGGPAVLGAAGGKLLAFTGIKAIKSLLFLGVGLIGLGTALWRRGRETTIHAGHALD